MLRVVVLVSGGGTNLQAIIDAIAAGKEALADKLTGSIIKEIYVPGKIVNITKDQIWISTGEGILAVNELQLEGKKRMNTEDFLRGYKMENAVLGMEE